MVVFISLIISYYLFLFFMIELVYSTKIKNIIVESLFFIPGVIAADKDDSKVKQMVESKIVKL